MYWECQRPLTLEEDLERMALELQVSEDTCKLHDVFLCAECFDLDPVEADDE